MKRRTNEADRAMAHVAAIAASVAALKDDDLLDLADIFAQEPASPLQAMASAEMAKRRLSL